MSDSTPTINDEINTLRTRLEAPIRQSHERTFSRLIDALMERARIEGNEVEKDRLISHGLAMRQQWIPLATLDDLLPAWRAALTDDGIKFLRRYNLFVAREIHNLSRKRWALLWNQSSLIMSLHRRIEEWGVVKNEEVTPILNRAKQDDPVTGQFGPLTDDKYWQLDSIYQQLEKNIFKYHAELIRGLRMEGEWMQEYGYEEPGPEMDFKNTPSESNRCDMNKTNGNSE